MRSPFECEARDITAEQPEAVVLHKHALLSGLCLMPKAILAEPSALALAIELGDDQLAHQCRMCLPRFPSKLRHGHPQQSVEVSILR